MRGVPLEEIAAATKINIRSLQALEAEEFSKLPGGIFTRSFVRAYARYLGLEEEPVIAEYQAVAPREEEADLSRMAGSKSGTIKETSRGPWLGILLAILLLSGGYALFRYSRRAVESQGIPANPSRASAPPTAAPASPPQSTALTTTTTAVPNASAAAPPTAPTAGQGAASRNPQDQSKTLTAATATNPATPNGTQADGGLVLQVAATEQTWVGVDADGKAVLQRILKPNDIQTFKAKNAFDVMTGNAQGIILTLNGETLKPLGRRGEVKKVHLTRDDLKNPGP